MNLSITPPLIIGSDQKVTEDFNIATCTRCNLCKTRRQPVLPIIVPNSKILFVGEAPSGQEEQYGVPFVGPAGQLLDRILQQVGINRSECSFVYVTQCRPPNNRPPEKDEIAACFDILDLVINKVKPEIIVPFGNVSLKRIAKRSGITKNNAMTCTHDNYPGINIVPIVHPNFVLRDMKNEILMVEGLKKVKSLLDGEVQVRNSMTTYVDTIEKFDLMMSDLEKSTYFALDIETDGTNFKTNNIISIGFSNKMGSAYVLPWVVGDEPFYNFCRQFALGTKRRDPINDVRKFCTDYNLNVPKFFWQDHPEVKSRLKALLANPYIPKILHNYSFDYKFLENADLLLKGKVFDTMLLHYLLDETNYTHGLDKCCLRFTNYGEYWKPLHNYIVMTEDKCDSYAIIPIDILCQYNGTDADVTFQIFEKFIPEILTEGFMPLYDNFIFPLTSLLMETEKNGIKIDEERRAEGEQKLKINIQNIDDKLNEFVKEVIYDQTKPEEKGINFNSIPQLKYLLFEYLRLPVINKTDKGEPSTDEATLEQLQNLSAVPKLLLDRRKKVKLLGTYFEGIKSTIWADGKVHPSFLLIGTVTGRLSAKNPNVQNQPRNPEEGSELYNLGIRVRDIFVCSDGDNYVIVETDYSQAELRLIAEFSRDRNLYNSFMQGRDPHAELAVRIYHRDRVADMEAGRAKAEDIVTPEERQKAKTANFSLVYGKAPINFAKENNLPLDEAIMIHTIYWETYTGISIWKQTEIQKANRLGYFTSLFGRRRRSKKIYSSDEYTRAEAEREGINSVIQSQASDYTLWAVMATLQKTKYVGLDAKPISFVHDSAVFEVRKDHLQIFLTILSETMLHPPGITIPMESEVKVGYRLGSLPKWFRDPSDNIWKEKPKKKKSA